MNYKSNNLSHFDQSALRWDNQEKINKAQKCAIRIRALLSALSSQFKIKNILEIGCGTGLLGGQFIAESQGYWGIDSSKEMLKVLKEKYPEDKVKTSLLDLDNEDLPREAFNLVLSQMAFHHIQNPQSIIKALSDRECEWIIIIDLLTEDGSFHPEPVQMGVKHFGFSESEVKSWLHDTSYSLHKFEVMDVIEKNDKKYPQFIAIIGK